MNFDDKEWIENEKVYCKWFAVLTLVGCAVFWGMLIAWGLS